jgi:hypothetical protein
MRERMTGEGSCSVEEAMAGRGTESEVWSALKV